MVLAAVFFVGVLLAREVQQRMTWPQAAFILLALTVSGSVGLIFGIYPAHRAAGLPPIVALNKE